MLVCVKMAKRIRKFLDSNMLNLVNNPQNFTVSSEDPGMEMIFEDETLAKEKKEEKKPKEPQIVKKAIRPIVKESVIDLKHLKDNENPEKMEYDYNTLEFI